MPILKREPDVFPESIFTMQEPWWVAHVRSRQEKFLARHLVQNGIAYYLPQVEKRGRRSSFLPLFPGYLFFRGTDGDTSRALRSHVIVNLLAPFDQPSFHGEIHQLHDLQRTSGRLTPYPHLHAGDSVHIHEGIFAGYRGTILRERGTERLIISISFINQSVVVDLDRDAIRPLHNEWRAEA